ncbi:hypothetical protein CspeluHIS016_0500990 [Cutaneotrichosporon spelunceum]|uniref:Uncharacterized protein n=1 Tax=Cutaneotrichosporon spelunceum TaxID=1672016 RepID=A0AAD3TWD2_9TREE|nr:hypothetical protein CspeluHIS016_0500990 [Cutaneotrichosporon spelunceum]
MRDNDALKTKLASSAAAEEDAKAQFADAVRTIEKLKAEIAHTPVQDDAIHLSPLLRKRMVKQGWSVGPDNGRKSATPKCVKPAARAGAPLSFHSPSDTCPLVGRVDVESPTDVSSISTALAIKSSNTATVQLGRRTGSSSPTLTKPPGVAGVYGSVVKTSRKKGRQTIDNSSITTALPTPEFDQSRVPLAHGKAVESEAKAKKSGKKKKMKKPAGENVL